MVALSGLGMDDIEGKGEVLILPDSHGQHG
jgi:hypothetical protein